MYLMQSRMQSQWNMPIFPARNPNLDKWRLVHELQAINQIEQGKTPIVFYLHTIPNIPQNTKWYMIIEHCSAVFSISLHPRHKVQYAGRQYT